MQWNGAEGAIVDAAEEAACQVYAWVGFEYEWDLTLYRNGEITEEIRANRMSKLSRVSGPTRCSSRPLRAPDRWILRGIGSARAAAERHTVGRQPVIAQQRKP
jgi:hypothetical protein